MLRHNQTSYHLNTDCNHKNVLVDTDNSETETDISTDKKGLVDTDGSETEIISNDGSQTQISNDGSETEIISNDGERFNSNNKNLLQRTASADDINNPLKRNMLLLKSEPLRKKRKLNDKDRCQTAISNMRNILNERLNELKTKMNEACEFNETEFFNAKKEETKQRERANIFEKKNADLHTKLKENHNVLLQMFEQ